MPHVRHRFGLLAALLASLVHAPLVLACALFLGLRLSYALTAVGLRGPTHPPGNWIIFAGEGSAVAAILGFCLAWFLPRLAIGASYVWLSGVALLIPAFIPDLISHGLFYAVRRAVFEESNQEFKDVWASGMAVWLFCYSVFAVVGRWARTSAPANAPLEQAQESQEN